jgi:hypothetical protein
MLGKCLSRPRMGATSFLRATGSSTTMLLLSGRYVAYTCRSLPTSRQAKGGAAGLQSHEHAFGLFAQQIRRGRRRAVRPYGPADGLVKRGDHHPASQLGP